MQYDYKSWYERMIIKYCKSRIVMQGARQVLQLILTSSPGEWKSTFGRVAGIGPGSMLICCSRQSVAIAPQPYIPSKSFETAVEEVIYGCSIPVYFFSVIMNII